MSVVVKSRFHKGMLESVDRLTKELDASRSEIIRMLVALGLKTYNMDKIDSAIGLYSSGKASLSEAAEIAGVPADVFYDILTSRKVKILSGL